MTRRILWVVAVLETLAIPAHGIITKCDQISSCSCSTDNGVLDLTPVGKTDGTARFKDVPSPSGDSFSWNPYNPFTENSCVNVASCQIQNILPPSYFNIGTADSAKFSIDPELGPQITYSANTLLLDQNLTFIRKTVVTLVCDESLDPGMVTAAGETPSGSGNYLLTLKSKYACEISNSGGLSVGSILVIIVFVVQFLYLVVGVSIQKFVRKAEGREMVPNYTFWSGLPGYIRDGFHFLFSLCSGRGRAGKAVGYNDI